MEINTKSSKTGTITTKDQNGQITEMNVRVANPTIFRPTADAVGNSSAATNGTGNSSAATNGTGNSSAATNGTGNSSAATNGTGNSSAATNGTGNSSAATNGTGNSSASGSNESRNTEAIIQFYENGLEKLPETSAPFDELLSSRRILVSQKN